MFANFSIIFCHYCYIKSKSKSEKLLIVDPLLTLLRFYVATKACKIGLKKKKLSDY